MKIAKLLIILCVFLATFLVGGIAWALDAPALTVTVTGTTVSLSWTSVADATGYTLYYAPYPKADPIGNIPMGDKTSMSASLPEGSAFYVALQAYNSFGNSGYSNIECFVINGSDADYKMTILGTLGGDHSHSNAINAAGQVVGGSQLIDAYNGYPSHAFLWQNGTMVDLGTLQEGNDYSVANGINNAGQVAGTSTFNGDYIGDGSLRAFLYQNGTMIDLGTLGGENSEAMGINDLGQVVGYASINEGDLGHFQYSRAFLWQNGTMTNLGTLGGYSLAWDINNSGDVVGHSYINQPTSGPIHAFLWQNGTMTDLGTLGGNSSAYGINEACQIVGSSNVTKSDYSPSHAFLWQNGTMTDLGTLGGNNSIAYAINASEQVVGSSNPRTDSWEEHAFLWENGTMYDLNDLVESDSKWTLMIANDINNYGQIACIAWTMEGENRVSRAVLLTPTDTSTQTINRYPRVNERK